MSERYRYLLRMPFELRDRLLDSAKGNGKSFNAEVLDRLEQSLEPRAGEAFRRAARGLFTGAHIPVLRGREATLSRRRLRLGAAGLAVAALLVGVAAAGRLTADHPSAAPVNTEGEYAPALAKKLARAATFAPPTKMSEVNEGDLFGDADQDWIEHATPGIDIPSAAITQSRSNWDSVSGRGGRGNGKWTPLGPVNGISPHNQYRDRSVYNAGTQNFGGRTAHVAIDPDCGKRSHGHDSCRLWIANANGGVWMTDDALDDKPDWEWVSESFEHQNVASLELDPNDRGSDTIWAGTGEPNACGSGCEAGVGLYRSTNGGHSWKGPFGKSVFNNRAVGSIAVEPGNSKVIFAASGRAIRGLSNVCCGGADAIIPGAAHFGIYRSTDGGQTWQIVSQGAPALCTDASPDVVSVNGTPCSPRGARRVMFDPVDPRTVYASFFARGIWRSNDLGNTWQQIMAPVGPNNNNERAEFDVVKLANGNTRMYVGVGGGQIGAAAAFARFRRNDDVRTAPGATVQGGWLDLTSPTPDTPGYSSFGFCDPQCSYDNYVYVPPGAGPDTVYLSGSNQYNENNFGPDPRGRSNGRAVVVSTDAGATFTDMTEDASDQLYPGALHPDHHALVTNPRNWKQFFDVGDGGVNRSNGTFVDDSGDCVDPKNYTGSQLTFCRMVLSRIPERLNAINEGLRTLHFYEINFNPHDPSIISGGTQDNGSWETVGSKRNWLNVNIADGNHNNYDVKDPTFRESGWQSGQLMVSYDLQDQVDQNWIADSLTTPGTGPVFYGSEQVAFVGPASTDPIRSGVLWTAREHVFRALGFGRNQTLTEQTHRENCNVWYGDFDLNDNGVFEPLIDLCDDWKALGDPGPNGRLTANVAAFGGADRAGGFTAAVERARNDTSTLWAGTSLGRIFVSKNADAADPTTVTFRRIDNTATGTPPRYPTAIYVDPKDANHAWISYSGFNAKTPATPGHIFEVRFDPAAGTATFTSLDGTGSRAFTDIPATSIAVSDRHSIYVGTDYGVMVSTRAGEWKPAGHGLPNVPVPDLVLVPQRGELYAATHGQGVWSLDVGSIERDDDRDWHH